MEGIAGQLFRACVSCEYEGIRLNVAMYMCGGGCLLTYIRHAVTQLLVIVREVYSLSFNITNCEIS